VTEEDLGILSGNKKEVNAKIIFFATVTKRFSKRALL